MDDKSNLSTTNNDEILSGLTEIRAIDQTPGYRFFDDKLISYHNNIYLEKYALHYCNIDKNMGSSMQV
jgi:hypothetical protein